MTDQQPIEPTIRVAAPAREWPACAPDCRSIQWPGEACDCMGIDPPPPTVPE